jgi:hypothetical protein
MVQGWLSDDSGVARWWSKGGSVVVRGGFVMV